MIDPEEQVYDAVALKQQIRNLIRNASLEITPGAGRKIDSYMDVMNPGRRVFVTYLPGRTPDDTIDTCAKLRRDGMEPVPHLAARSMTGPEQLRETLERLRAEADVRDVLIIGGGGDKPVGTFTSTMDMLETGYFQDYGMRSIGVAGHPEGSPDISEDAIREALLYKNRFAMENNIHMYIVTQFVFEARPLVDWLYKVYDWGNRLPVNVGLFGPAKFKVLAKYAQMCGVRFSVGFLRKQGLRALKMTAEGYPDRLITELARYVDDTPDTLITRLHFYNFGGVTKTMNFIHAVRDGDFTMKPFGGGFRLTRDI